MKVWKGKRLVLIIHSREGKCEKKDECTLLHGLPADVRGNICISLSSILTLVRSFRITEEKPSCVWPICKENVTLTRTIAIMHMKILPKFLYAIMRKWYLACIVTCSLYYACSMSGVCISDPCCFRHTEPNNTSITKDMIQFHLDPIALQDQSIFPYLPGSRSIVENTSPSFVDEALYSDAAKKPPKITERENDTQKVSDNQ